ncbi:hypothetical protein BDY19DRAFT_906700 [Irpex rosettiformis]|uniref:Uncharacterized protein n=1 Tax=Irpex rosettiformis TaxID=378272 RepID=A0ACB8U381_9APHY|nr:hypothetical protein BDY19DRAFT_906700 [Irpex rosettiformis]
MPPTLRDPHTCRFISYNPDARRHCPASEWWLNNSAWIATLEPPMIPDIVVNENAPAVFSVAKANARRKSQTQVSKEKKHKSARVEYYDGMLLAEFTRKLLATHGIEEIYVATASVIDKNQDFISVLHEILASKKLDSLNLNIDFDLDGMNPYCKNQPLNPTVDPQLELTIGTQHTIWIPQIAQFSLEEQLHGNWILELEKRWKCAHHKNQSGGNGACYWTDVADKDSHYVLSLRRLKVWSVAIAAHQATIEVPPPHIFDGGQDGMWVKPRGMTGPRPDPSSAAASSDISALLTLTMVPMVVICMKQMMETMSTSRVELLPVKADLNPSPVLRAEPQLHREAVTAGDELRRCLQDFSTEYDIDLMHFIDTLTINDFTPDIIPHLSTTRLLQIFEDVAEGSVVKFQLFTKNWHVWLTQVQA